MPGALGEVPRREAIAALVRLYEAQRFRLRAAVDDCSLALDSLHYSLAASLTACGVGCRIAFTV